MNLLALMGLVLNLLYFNYLGGSLNLSSNGPINLIIILMNRVQIIQLIVQHLIYKNKVIYG